MSRVTAVYKPRNQPGTQDAQTQADLAAMPERMFPGTADPAILWTTSTLVLDRTGERRLAVALHPAMAERQQARFALPFDFPQSAARTAGSACGVTDPARGSG